MITRLEFGEDEVYEAMNASNVKRTLSQVWSLREGLRTYLKHSDNDPIDYLEYVYDELCEIEDFTV